MSPLFLNSGCKSDTANSCFCFPSSVWFFGAGRRSNTECTGYRVLVVCFGFIVLPPIALRIDGGPWGPNRSYGDPMGDSMGSRSRLVAKCTEATLFESIFKLAKGDGAIGL